MSERKPEVKRVVGKALKLTIPAPFRPGRDTKLSHYELTFHLDLYELEPLFDGLLGEAGDVLRMRIEKLRKEGQEDAG